MAPSKHLVLGLGNDLAGDDGFGPAVVARLQATAAATLADLVAAHTDLLAHVDTLPRYEQVVLVDAVLGLGDDRAVHVFDEADLAGWPDRSASCHSMSPLIALRLFRQLYPAAPTRVRLVALAARRIAPGDLLPASAVDAGVAAVLRCLEA
jgi:hydrogenase maturation protease